ncbi:MAG: M23 family metallopeptidase [Pseudomonadota bacterium]
MRLRALGLVLALAAFLLAPADDAAAEQIRFELPVDCQIGEYCTIQNFFDHDQGPGRLDYTCGRLSYDGHKGTDFRVPNLPARARGVPVVAAAPGTVLRVRDGMEDVSVKEIGRDALGGRDAGNGVVIDHGNGWQTQYSHLRKGSMAVAPGQQVEAGEQLGLIGLSGFTEFPHVHFSVRYRGEDIDPFVGLGGFKGCEAPRQPLWSDRALEQLAYQATGILAAGFAEGRPTADDARAGRTLATLDPRAPALIFWVDVFGVMDGDLQHFAIEAPDGQVLYKRDSEIETSKVIWFTYSGRKRKAAHWPPGVYRGRYRLTRDGQIVDQVERQISVP